MIWCILSYRVQLSEPVKEVLRGLLERQVTARLCSGPGGCEELKRSSFFSPIDFRKVYDKEYPPEFRPPKATSDTDVRNFDQEFTSEPAGDSLVTTHMTNTMQEKSNFEGFTFQGDSAIDK